MENIRCLIADIPHIILEDIIRKIIMDRPGIEVVDHFDSNNNISQVIKEHSIDVLIVGMEAETAFQTLNEVVNISPKVVTIGVVADGRRICVCVDDVGPGDLVELVDAAFQSQQYKSSLAI